MALPGHRRTSSDKRRRAAHFALKKQTIGVCGTCGKPVRPHAACGACGSYRGRSVLPTQRATARLLKKAKAPAPTAEPKKITASKKEAPEA